MANDDRITREDLTLLMSSYKNMIELNISVLEKQDHILEKIRNTYDDVKENAKEIRENFNFIKNHCNECNKLQTSNNEELKTIISKQDIKTYGVYGLFLTIIMGLVGLVYKVLNP